MPNEPSNDPKIIVDEDWKTQVEREKQEAEAADAAETPTSEKDEAPPADQSTGQLPPVSFEIHVSSIATQVLVALGQMDDPIEGKPRVNLDFAKFQIDMLAMLQEKTKGNLNDAESQMIEDAVHQLRMMFVQVQGQVQQ